MGAGRTPTWLGPFFRLASSLPSVARAARPLATRLTALASAQVRCATRLNARRIFGRELNPAAQRAFTRNVVGSFYDFVCDVGRASGLTADQLHGLVAHVDGLDGYRAARASSRGAILVTAHLGSFEAGLAALASEENRIRVVFRTDAAPAFERARSRLRSRLGVLEAPIDQGWGSWMPLRDALRNNEVVVMQGDRAVAGQRSEALPILHGHIRLPTGPVRLARITGSPIIPVFAPRQADGRYRIVLGVPIKPVTTASTSSQPDTHEELTHIARAIEQIIASYPEQWLMLEPAFVEDHAHGG